MIASRSPRRRANPARTFSVVVGLLLSVALLSWAFDLPSAASKATYGVGAVARGLAILEESDDSKCRLVHQATDPCAHVKTYCADEDAGLLSYLDLYYCRLDKAKPLGLTIIIVWTALLFTTIGVAASDFFCINLSTISSILGLSESMAGVTFLAFGNGSPDVFSTFAAIKSNSGSLAVGELIGAAGFITTVVAGSMALIRPFKVAKKSFVRDVGFFILAVSFSVVFMANGKLELWEAAVMVGFYVFYVCFVVVWHWWLGRRRRRRDFDSAVRGHYVTPGSDEIEVEQYYDDEANATRSRNSTIGVVSNEDFDDLEMAGLQSSDDELDEDETRAKWMGELSNNMRVTKPPMRERRSTYTPIRPSLVGALEFRAVLASLEKSRNHRSQPINLRRYSDAPYYTSAQQQALPSSTPNPVAPAVYNASVQEYQSPALERVSTRTRAVSVNDAGNTNIRSWAANQHQQQNSTRRAIASLAVPSLLIPDDDLGISPYTDCDMVSSPMALSPVLSISHPTSETMHIRSPVEANGSRLYPANHLAPPSLDSHSPPGHHTHESPSKDSDEYAGRNTKPKLRLTPPTSGRSSPRTSRRPSPIIPYEDEPRSGQGINRNIPTLLLPPSSSESLFPESLEHKQLRRWPRFLPGPNVLARALFPTLSDWGKKPILEKLLGLALAPSFFLLTITLPVVELDTDENCTVAEEIMPSSTGNFGKDSRSSVEQHNTSATAAVAIERQHRHSLAPSVGSSDPMGDEPEPEPEPFIVPTSAPINTANAWNRWLVFVQCYTAPFFIVFIIWANTSDSPRALLRPALYSLLGSSVALILLMLTTTTKCPPRWHFLLCFAGFAVSITWISTIANEVVGVLKTIGVIFNISDAILGLTIFAVGNSLGDLVADITVARLNFPVMALSACFGGPMLNILLGIGLSGLYMTVRGAEKHAHKHHDKHLKFKPYHVEVSATLLISTVVLLVTLLFLLVAVPLNNWRMDRRIGWSLIILWVVATIGNVIVEVTGVAEGGFN